MMHSSAGNRWRRGGVVLCGGLLTATLLGCAGTTAVQSTLPQKAAVSPWVQKERLTPTHFVGIGSAAVGGDRGRAGELARASALRQIAEQIEVRIVADVNLAAVTVESAGSPSSRARFAERIATATAARLSGWRELASWEEQGQVWSMVVLRRADYAAQLNRPAEQARALLCDLLARARQGSLLSRLTALHRGLEILDKWGEAPLTATLEGRRVILNHELPQQLASLLAGVEIRPTLSALQLAPTASVPESLGVRVFVNGQPDSSVGLLWSSSEPRVGCVDAGRCGQNRHAVRLRPLPPTAAAVTVTARLDPGPLRYDLLGRRFSLPFATFTVWRQKAGVYCQAEETLRHSLSRSLGQQAGIELTDQPEDALFTLLCEVRPGGEPVVSNSVYLATASLAVKLVGRDGTAVVEVNKQICAADGRSAQGAQHNAQLLAMEETVRQIQEAF